MLSGNDDRGSFRRGLFAVAVIGSVLALVLPYVLVLASDTPGIIGIQHEESAINQDSDVYEQAWHFWWVSTALINGQDPRFCPFIYSPEGVSLVTDHIGWFDTLVFAIIGIGKDHPALSHTLSLLLGTLLTALFGWLLARSWGADRYGALFTALALAWLPSRTAHLLQHYQLANCWTLPASLWLCREYLRTAKLKTLAAYTAIVILAALQSPFIAIFAVIGLPATCFIVNGNWKRTGILALGAAAAALITGILIFTAPGDPVAPSTHWREAIYWAAEPQSFILPSPFGPAGYFLGIPMRFSWMSNTAEGVVTPGLTLLAAFTVLIWKKKNWRLPIVFLGLGLLALGPELRIFGRPLGVPLPFRIVQLFPMMDGIRAPSRFAIMGSLFVALGAGLGVSQLKVRWKMIFFILLLFELSVPAFNTLPTPVPSACRNIPADRIVMELPVDNHVRMYSWFQTAASYSRRYAFLARLPEMEGEDVLMREAFEEGYVLLYHRWLFNEEDRNRYDTLYAAIFPEGSFEDSVWVNMNGGAK